jgi:hypothetical protein
MPNSKSKQVRKRNRRNIKVKKRVKRQKTALKQLLSKKRK